MAERLVFTEESIHERRIKVLAEGNLDGTLLDALQSFIDRQRKRLSAHPAAERTGESGDA